MRSISYWLLGAGAAFISVSAYCYDEPLAGLDLETLMSLDVQATSVMKRAESVADTPASIYVLTSEQILRSGVTTLTEAISLIPGLFYRELNNAQRAVGVRLAPDALNPNLLVMVDGRYFYNPAFPGIAWEHLDIPLRDIERIELVRGSGGTLWSSKAANGSINIITKHSVDTLGTEITLGAGNQVESLGNIRYGGLFGDGGSFRINLKSLNTNRSGPLYQEAYDGQALRDVSTRIDYVFNDDLSLMFKASYLDADIERTMNKISSMTYQAEPLQDDTSAGISNMMLRLDQRLSASLSHMLQVTYTDSDIRMDSFSSGEIEVFNINYAMNYEFDRHKLDWGLEYQYNGFDLVDNQQIMKSSDSQNSLNNYGVFVQDEFALIPGEISVISAVRIDKDQIAGWEYQPSLRVLQKLSPANSIWGGVSRSVMTPTLFSVGVSALQHSPIPFVPLYFTGDPGFDSEKYDNYELGYRGQFEAVEIDLSLYRTESDNVVALQAETVGTFPLISRIDNRPVNEAHFVSHGGELVVNLQPLPNWILQLGLAYHDQEVSSESSRAVPVYSSTIQKQLSLRSDYQISSSLNSYVKVAYMNEYPDSPTESIDAFTTVDAGITWQVNPELELGLYGQNLFDSDHAEFPANSQSLIYSTELERGLYARAVLSF